MKDIFIMYFHNKKKKRVSFNFLDTSVHKLEDERIAEILNILSCILDKAEEQNIEILYHSINGITIDEENTKELKEIIEAITEIKAVKHEMRF